MLFARLLFARFLKLAPYFLATLFNSLLNRLISAVSLGPLSWMTTFRVTYGGIGGFDAKGMLALLRVVSVL